MGEDDSNIDKLNLEKYNTIMPESDDRALCMEVDKPISRDGYLGNFVPRVEAMLKARGEIRLLVHFKEYHGWEAEAATMSMGGLMEYGSKFRKFALVNPPKKEILRSKVNDPLMSGETRYFETDELQDAIAWVKE
ncbi:MAG: STAS/SEC14 domain-containing protein [Alphaproteobacteria bacterium]|nr:STAS/SEC14 domain-containing protein [Alphaproteobacteria bacterium]MBU0858532.1 STAS/SEC14 domain-containing protein [Alphaproteobacteria bacterium]